jgi:predicted HTH transcriptional regulator
MSLSESQYYDKKSLRCITGRTADWAEIAKDCVAFANAKGGRLAIGIEDLEEQPPAAQRVEAAMVDRVRKRLRELTVNVEAHPELVTAPNGGMFVDVLLPRATSVASSSDGRYFIRIGDESRPVLGQLRFEASTTLARIEPHRLRELLLEDLRRYPGSAIGASHARIGREIPLSQVKRKLEQMEAGGAIRHEGDFRWRRYWAVE